MEFRDYQIEISEKAVKTLTDLKIVYLAMEVRTGKTLTALQTAQLYGAKKVLFLTKLKAISEIQKDFDLLKPNFQIQIINNESLHKITDTDFDLLISDEHHRCVLGNTLLNNVKIKDIEVGSLQKSFNFVKNNYEYKKVLKVHKNKLSENLIKIKCNGKEIICTESHKIYTKRGWVSARNILSSDELQVV
ncbi:MAG: DEAD/DEAH box helicase family protein [Lutibacter sp.]|jgi:hypothetical protein